MSELLWCVLVFYRDTIQNCEQLFSQLNEMRSEQKLEQQFEKFVGQNSDGGFIHVMKVPDKKDELSSLECLEWMPKDRRRKTHHHLHLD